MLFGKGHRRLSRCLIAFTCSAILSTRSLPCWHDAWQSCGARQRARRHPIFLRKRFQPPCLLLCQMGPGNRRCLPRPKPGAWHARRSVMLGMLRRVRSGRPDGQTKPRDVRSLWTLFTVPDLETAKSALADREGINSADIPRNIGYVSSTGPSHGQAAETIGRLASSLGLDAVVWTNGPPKFQHERRVPIVEEILTFLRTRPEDAKQQAEEYIRKTPKQIDTVYRRRIEAELNWTPIPGSVSLPN